jgi:hypothetical protein
VTDGPELGKIESETEEVDAVLVPAGEAPLPAQASRGRALAGLREVPAARAVAVAAGGFVAGAAVVGLTRRRHAVARRGRRRLQVLGSRSFLVDVHLLAPVVRQR